MAKMLATLQIFQKLENAVRLRTYYVLPSCITMTWVPTAGRRKPHQRTGQQFITQQAHSLPSDVLAAGQTPMPLPVSVARHAKPGFHVQKGR